MAELEYLDFDLSIEGGKGKYQARVLNSPAGQAKSAFSRVHAGVYNFGDLFLGEGVDLG